MVALVALGVVAVLRRERRVLLAWGVVFAEEVEPGVRGDLRRAEEGVARAAVAAGRLFYARLGTF